MPLWLAAISALPHKEERFLYVIYPLVRPQRKIASLSSISTMQAPCKGSCCNVCKVEQPGFLVVCVEPLHRRAGEWQ